MKHYKFITLLFILVACDVSTISDADAGELSKLRVFIDITDDGNEQKLKEIKVRLNDGEKQIINDKIKMLLNGAHMELYVKDELYYTKTSYYRDTGLVRQDAYYFEMIAPDGSKHPIAFIKPSITRDSAALRMSADTTVTKENGLINPNLISGSLIRYTVIQ